MAQVIWTTVAALELEGNYRLMYELLDADVILIQPVIHQARQFTP